MSTDSSDGNPPLPAAQPSASTVINYSGGLRGQLERLLAACSSRGVTPPEPWFDLSADVSGEDLQSYAFQLNEFAYRTTKSGKFHDSETQTTGPCHYHVTITSKQPNPKPVIATLRQIYATPKLSMVSAYIELFGNGNPHIHCLFSYPVYLTARLKNQWFRTNGAYLHYQKVTPNTEHRVSGYGAKPETKPDAAWFMKYGLPYDVDMLGYINQSRSAAKSSLLKSLSYAEPALAGEAEPAIVSRGVPQASTALRALATVTPKPKVSIRMIPKK